MCKFLMTIENWNMVSHVSLDDYVMALYQGTILAPGHPLYGKTLVKETHTPRKDMFEFEEGTTTFYLAQHDSEMFDTLTAFCDRYGLEYVEPVNTPE